jgi:hypothetical protein
MWEELNFTQHGKIEITDKLVELATTHNWTKEHLMRLHDKNFKGSQCIYYDFTNSVDTYKQLYDNQDYLLLSSTQYILDYVLTLWPNYRFIKGEIGYCLPGERQGFHIDPRVFHRFSHRVHIPITTNSDCVLKVLSDYQHLAKGEIWTFNNLKAHASENLGNTGRTHVIVDIMNQAIFDKIVSKYGESYLYELTTSLDITV